MRIVLDTNTLIRAHGRVSSLARRLLVALLEQGHRLVLSNELLVEVAKVLRYPRFQQIYGLSDADIFEYVQYLQSASHLVSLDHFYRAPLRDPTDLIVLQTAELGDADLLCSNDADFFDPLVQRYCAALGIEICDEVMLAERIL